MDLGFFTASTSCSETLAKNKDQAIDKATDELLVPPTEVPYLFSAMASSTHLGLASAKPYAFQFEPERTALVIIDVQRDFVDPNGFGAIQCGDEEIFSSVRSIVPAIQDVLAASRQLGLHVIHTREGHRPDLSDLAYTKRDRQINAPSGHHTMGIGDQGPMGRLLIQGEYGHDVIDELRPLPGEPVVDKPGKGSFWDTTFHRTLMARGITHLLICGVTTECCVTTTAREANDRGFECCILADCTGGFNATSVDVSLNMFCSYDGLFGFVGNSNELVAHSRRMMQTPPDSPAAWAGDISIETLRKQLRGRRLPISSLVKEVFGRIKKADPLIWTHIRSEEDVLAEANALQAQYAAKSSEELPPLYGIPFAVKDNFDVAGMPTDAACPAYRYVPEDTAPVIKILISAGALLIGKTNMDQLATGLNGCRSPFGNPTSVYGRGKYISGGSSSGSGVAVAAGLVTLSLGTDTAGSGRVPASFNGIVGYKPTKGTLSARGIVPACKSLDTASIFATSILDARQVWYAIAQYDAQDPYAKPLTSLPLSVSDYRSNPPFTFAIPPTSLLSQCSPSYNTAFTTAVNTLKHLGGILLRLSESQYAPFATASQLLYASSLVQERIASIGHEFLTTHLASLHPTTRALVQAILDRPTQAWEVFRDQHAQATATAEAARLFYGSEGCGTVDVLVTPTVPWHPTVEEMEREPIEGNARLGLFTHFGNVLDLCAVSLPAGLVEVDTKEGDGEGEGERMELPFGLQLVCARGLDGKMFDLARRFERVARDRESFLVEK